jgi:hypothetical protein
MWGLMPDSFNKHKLSNYVKLLSKHRHMQVFSFVNHIFIFLVLRKSFKVPQIPLMDYIQMKFEQEELHKKMHVREADVNVAKLYGSIDTP